MATMNERVAGVVEGLLGEIRKELFDLEIEINCRREHGAEGAEHLKYIEGKLKLIREAFLG